MMRLQLLGDPDLMRQLREVRAFFRRDLYKIHPRPLDTT
jgi:hypothetical protein